MDTKFISTRKFIESDYYLNNEDPEKKYIPGELNLNPIVEWGQRKLLIGEIQFLSNYWNKINNPNPILVYIGASPGNHIKFLIKLFPDFEYHLYDPRPSSLNKSDKIFIYTQLFTSKDAEKWSNKKIYFITDIRDDNLKCMSKEKQEETIKMEMKLQLEWIKIMKPIFSQIKFRLPYIDYAKDKNNKTTLEYPCGKLYKQAYAKKSSNELRLVTDGKFNKIWNVNKIERQMAYHNKILRGKNIFLNPFTGKLEPIDEDELLNDYDSLLETNVIIDYLKKICNYNNLKQEDVIFLSKLITDFFHEEKSIENRKLGKETLNIIRKYSLQKR